MEPLAIEERIYSAASKNAKWSRHGAASKKQISRGEARQLTRPEQAVTTTEPDRETRKPRTRRSRQRKRGNRTLTSGEISGGASAERRVGGGGRSSVAASVGPPRRPFFFVYIPRRRRPPRAACLSLGFVSSFTCPPPTYLSCGFAYLRPPAGVLCATNRSSILPPQTKARSRSVAMPPNVNTKEERLCGNR